MSNVRRITVTFITRIRLSGGSITSRGWRHGFVGANLVFARASITERANTRFAPTIISPNRENAFITSIRISRVERLLYTRYKILDTKDKRFGFTL